jgi:hypothetical protein
MKISRFNKFINESTTSHTQDYDTFMYIFIELVDEGFKLEVKNVFMGDKYFSYADHPDQEKKIPSYIIELSKNIEEGDTIDYEIVKKTIKDLDECNNRLKDYGDLQITELSFVNGRGYSIEYRLKDKEAKVEEVNETEGFDTFIHKISSKWDRTHNKLTRSFNFERTKDGIILSPIDPSVNTKSLLSTAKRFIDVNVHPRVFLVGGPNWKYNYDVSLEGGSANNFKINIKYKNRVDKTHE